MRRFGTFMMTLGWLMLAGVIWWGFDLYLNPNADLASIAEESGEVELKRGPDGHYRAPGRINGEAVQFMVDTGATVIALPDSVAHRLGLVRGRAVRVHTANGEAVAFATRLAEVNLGGAVAYDVAANIVPGMAGEHILLGMSFLARFEIAMSGDVMRIRGR